MATAVVVHQDNPIAALDGHDNSAMRTKFAKKFREWCDSQHLQASPQNMRVWDEQNNLSRWRKLYASDDDVFERGLKDVYTQIFYTYSSMKFDGANGATFSTAVVRKVGPGVGNFGDVTSPALTKPQKNYVLEKAQRDLDNATERVALLSMTRKQILARVVGKLDEMKVQ